MSEPDYQGDQVKYCIWIELGRFAVEYRRMFEEPPSETQILEDCPNLAAPGGARQAPDGSLWPLCEKHAALFDEQMGQMRREDLEAIRRGPLDMPPGET